MQPPHRESTNPARFSHRRIPRLRGSTPRRVAALVAFVGLASAACSKEIAAAPVGTRKTTAASTLITPSADLTTLLTAARGAPAPLCALAARTVSTRDWFSTSSDAPRTPLSPQLSPAKRGGASGEAGDERDDINGRLSPSDQQLLLDNLSASDLCVRELSVRLLTARRRNEAVGALTDTLVTRLEAQDESVREVVAFGLGMLSHSSATLALVRRLRDAAAGVRANAAWALGRIEDGRALSGLLAVSNDVDATVRYAAVTSLGKLDSTRAISAVMRALQRDSVPSVRRVAAWALAQLGGEPAALSLLATVLSKDSDATVREMCAWALGELEARTAAEPLADAAMRDRSPKVRETAVWALGEIEATGSATTLGTVLVNDTSLSVRRTAAWALGQLDIRVAPKGLVTALNDPDERLRFHASWALSEIRDPASIPALKAALAKETHKQARRAQLRAILSAGGRTESMLTDLLQSSDPDVREAAIRGVAGGNMIDPWPWPWPRPRPFP